MEIVIIILLLINISATVYCNLEKFKPKTAAEKQVIEENRKTLAEEAAEKKRADEAKKAMANLMNFNSYKKKYKIADVEDGD